MELTRHYKRDSELPKQRQILLQSVLDDLGNDSNVLGIYLGGSLARGNADNYSDIDLRVVVNPDELNNYISQKKVRPEKWGNVLFYEDISVTAPFTIAHFDCFIKVDVFYYKPTDLKPSLWLKDNYILKDTNGMIQKILDDSNKLTYHPTVQEVELWRVKSLAYVQEVYRRVMRGELYYALNQINSLRWFIVNGWDMEAGRLSNSGWDWSKIEGERSNLDKYQLSLLEGWSCSRDRHSIIKTLASMMPEFLRLNTKLSQIVGIEEQKKLCQDVIDSVL